MRIGIDARLIPYPKKEGMAYYAWHLIDNLLKIDPVNRYVLLYNLFFKGNKRLIFDLASFKNARNNIFWIPGKILDRLWAGVHFPPIEFLAGRIDIFHTLSITASPPYFYIPPQIWGRKIITIHDISPLLFPGKAKDVFNIRKYKKGLNEVLKKADAVICVSCGVQKDLIKYSGVPEDKTQVIYYGLSDDFSKPAPERINTVLNKYRISGKYILNVSRLDYNKNLINLIRAFSLFRKDYDFKLVIAGSPGNTTDEFFKAIEESGLSKDIMYLGYVVREDLVALYSAAELLVFPSIYEGLGFPNLEAMKCAVPVVTSDIPIMREIVGDAALLVDPHSPQAISQAMGKVIADNKLRDDLVAKGIKRAKLFSWQKTAQDTLTLYQKVAAFY